MRFFSSKPDDYFDNRMRDFPLASKVLFWIVIGIVWLFSKIYWRWTQSGPNPFTHRSEGEATRGRVIVANHASMLDPVIMIIACAFSGGRVRPLYKAEFEKSKLISWFFGLVGAMPVKRDTADLKAIKRAVRCIGDGEDICVFPEGTRIKDPNARPEVHGGFALIAQMAKCDVVPVAIEGSQNIVPTGKGFPRPAKVRVLYGDPISLDDMPGETRKEKTAALEKAAMEEVYRLRGVLRAQNGS